MIFDWSQTGGYLTHGVAFNWSAGVAAAPGGGGIDTAAKRASCFGLDLEFLRPGIIPTGSDLSAPERLHTQLSYAGIAAGAAVIIRPLIRQTVVMRRTNAATVPALASFRTTVRAVASHRQTVRGD